MKQKPLAIITLLIMAIVGILIYQRSLGSRLSHTPDNETKYVVTINEVNIVTSRGGTHHLIYADAPAQTKVGTTCLTAVVSITKAFWEDLNYGAGDQIDIYVENGSDTCSNAGWLTAHVHDYKSFTNLANKIVAAVFIITVYWSLLLYVAYLWGSDDRTLHSKQLVGISKFIADHAPFIGYTTFYLWVVTVIMLVFIRLITAG